MATAEPKTYILNDQTYDANGVIPGTTFPEKAQEQLDAHSTGEPPSFKGPEVNNRPTTATLFSPAQLRRSSLLPSLYRVINDAFDVGHVGRNGELYLTQRRLRYDDQFLDQLGTAPGTFTYVVFYSGTREVVGTASAKRYLGKVYVPPKDDEERKAYTWRRFGAVPDGTIAWELSTMAVDPSLMRQGLASHLMKWTEDEIKRRFMVIVNEAKEDAKPTQLLTMITTIKQQNFDFYSRRGFVKNYETQYEKGWLGGEHEFIVINMSKVIEVGDLLG